MLIQIEGASMGKIVKTLGDAEFEIMQIIWTFDSPISSTRIHAKLLERRNWHLSTLMTVLARLVKKGFLCCDRSTGSNLYSALIQESDYKLEATKAFIDKMYGGSLQELILTISTVSQSYDNFPADPKKLSDILTD